MTTASELSINLPIIFSAPQLKPIRFRLATRDIGFYIFLGEYGSGKSLAAAAAYMEHCVSANPFIEGLHETGSAPTSAIIAPTFGDIMDGPYKQLRRLVPDDLIYRERLYHPYMDIEWVNGHVTTLCSSKGAINGPSWVGEWVDEIQEKPYANTWHNIQARVRDGRAERMTRNENGTMVPAGKLSIIVSGLASRNHVEDLFRYHTGPNQCLVVMETDDNRHNLGGNAVEELKARMPDSAFDKDAEGWTMPQNIAYPWFTTRDNIEKATGPSDYYERPVTLGVDLRKHAAVTFLVPGAFPWSANEPAGLIVDEWLPDNYSAGMIARELRSGRFPWKIVPNLSAICLDPTASVDEVQAFEKAFPGVPVVQYRKGAFAEARNGRRAVAIALRDERKVTRLRVLETLDPGHERGIVRMFREWDGRRDGRFEHVADTVRYAVQHAIPGLLTGSYATGITGAKRALPPGTESSLVRGAPAPLPSPTSEPRQPQPDMPGPARVAFGGPRRGGSRWR